MHVQGEISGTLTPQKTISGRLSAPGRIAGTLSLPPQPEEYQGAYVFTPSHEEQTAATRGLLLTDDITVNALGENVIDTTIQDAATPATILAGRKAYANGQLITGNLQDTWLGLETQLVDNFYSETYRLADTGFNGWTPSTTAKTIIATKNIDTFHADLANYEYWLCWQIDIDFKYLAGVTLKAAPERYVASLWQNIHRRPYGFQNFEEMDDSYNYCTTAFSGASYIDYYNASGSHTWAAGVSYGIYGAAQAAAFNSTASLTPTVTRKAPPISARCSTTYFNTTVAPYVDQDNTTIKLAGRMYRVKQGSSDVRHFYRDALTIYNNPL